MSNDHIKSEISSYLTGGLTESRNRQIEGHIASCEKCRNALTKAKAKQARVKREALKKASTDPLPNLFLARQGKNSGIDVSPSKAPRIFLVLLLLAGAGYWFFRHRAMESQVLSSSATDSESASVQTSSAPVVVSVAAPVAPTATAPPPAPQSEPVKPLPDLAFQKEWKGLDCGILASRAVVVRDQKTWESLWTEMKTEAPAPEVNFEKHTVVGVFGGERPAGSTVALGTPREHDDNVRVYFRVIPSEVATSTAAAPGHPYVLGILPQVDKKIQLIEKEASQ